MNTTVTSDRSPAEMALIVEVSYLAGTINRLEEAVHVLSRKRGYESLSDDDRLFIGDQALSFVPGNLSVRRQPSIDMTQTLAMKPSFPIAGLALPQIILDALQSARIDDIATLTSASSNILRGLASMTDAQIDVVNRIVALTS